MEPLILNPIYKEKVWGSNELLQKFNKTLEKGKIGESWNFVLDDNNSSKFQDLKGDIKELFLNQSICRKVFGSKVSKTKHIPFLIKTLFVNDRISLQVHPNNRFAQINENELGKNEVWYILYADEDSYVNIGFKYPMNKRKIKKLLEKNEIMHYVKKIKVRAGDIINIPAGTVHSVFGKAIIYEVQQNSNITYRLYDWHERNLEIEKALKVIKNKNVIVRTKMSGRLIKTKDFTIERINVFGRKEMKSRNRLQVITIIEGEGSLVTSKDIKLNKGMTILIPAELKKYVILGNISMLITN